MAEEVWVGTWRPHRPRGPIMALYSSPGPKYLIPPTTGKQAPVGPGGDRGTGVGAGSEVGLGSVSLGLTPDSRTSSLLGPWDAGRAGAWPQATQSPCSAGFAKHTPTKPRAPAYSFRGAPMLLAENCSPGPRYCVNPKILRTGKDLGPAFSILGRYSTKTLLTPGPGEWQPRPGPSRRCEGVVSSLSCPVPLLARGRAGAADLSAA